MSGSIALPLQFFAEYCHGFIGLEVVAETDEDFDLMTTDLDQFKAEVADLRRRASDDGVLDEMKLALEYLIAIDDDEIPKGPRYLDTAATLVSHDGPLTAVTPAALRRLLEWTRAVSFPDAPAMSADGKEAAKKRVRPVNVDLDEWLEARGLERGSKPGVWDRRQEAEKGRDHA